ncbi:MULTISPECIES: hypothetical protein [unclassified Microcoleus]|uniref:hypothetical protein n=1 Tax=unclassified Microcoleus TaxID=2642155 RepID=UPI002FD0B528
MWCAKIDRPYRKKVRSPATTKSFQRQEYCTAARSLLKCDRADFCQTPLKVVMNALTCYR